MRVPTEIEFSNEIDLLIMEIQQTPNASMGSLVVATKYSHVFSSYVVTAIN